MEKETFFCNPTELNWKMQHSGAAAQLPKLSSGHLNLTCGQTIDQSANFELALTSLVSSPSSNPPASTADSLVIRELIGRLGSICNSDEISPKSSPYPTANNSCQSSPLSSPPKLNLSVFSNPVAAANPSLVERAARYSTFCGSGSRSYGGGQFTLPEAGKLSRVFSSQSLKATSGKFNNGMPVSNDGELRNALEDSPASGNGKKRKVVPKGKGKESLLPSSVTAVTNPPKGAGVEDCNAKRSKPSESIGTEKDSAQRDGCATKKKQEEEKSAEPPELYKDYIHVRARRGQATDSHSLAERVRREKISERMKLLQELVPGCNKVTGKAVMLDEIINYVQSLQRQVEFLSMKLATVNPQLDFNTDNFVPIDIHQICGPLPQQQAYLSETTPSTFAFAMMPQGAPLIANGIELQCEVNRLGLSSLGTNLSIQLRPLQGFGDASSQLGTFWDDDLQSVVQMGFSQNQKSAFTSQNFQGSAGKSSMMVEL